MTRPGYKITEIGEIPEEWVTRKFHEILATVKGKPPNTLLDYDESEKLLPYLSAEYLRGHYEKAKYCFIEDDKRITTVDVDDIIVIWDGNAGEFFSGMKGILSSTMAKLIFKDERISREFIYYFLKKCEGKLKNTTKGSTIPHLDGNILSNLDILLPTLQEQQKIAEILTTAEDAIQKVNEQITLTEQLKKGLMQKLLTKGIGHTKFKKTEIGEIPEEWGIKPLKSVANVEYGKANPKTKGTIPLVGSSGTFDYVAEPLIKTHTIVIGRKGTAGALWEINTASWPSDTSFYLEYKEKLVQKFLFEFMNLNRLSGDKAKTTLPSLQRTDVESFLLAIPPLHEQQKIAKILNTADRKLELLRNKKEQAEHMKKGLMQSLLTGQVRVKINSIKGDN